jgi:hypothetical protein
MNMLAAFFPVEDRPEAFPKMRALSQESVLMRSYSTYTFKNLSNLCSAANVTMFAFDFSLSENFTIEPKYPAEISVFPREYAIPAE